MRRFAYVQKYAKLGYALPTRATPQSAGYDFISVETITIAPGEMARVSTGVKVYLEPGEVLFLISRSSLPSSKNLMIPNGIGVIDADYVDNDANEGEIMMQLYNFGSTPVTINEGERLGQGIISKYEITDPDFVQNKERKGGFGSSGK
jgi:dUTP pyrophosphatase